MTFGYYKCSLIGNLNNAHQEFLKLKKAEKDYIEKCSVNLAFTVSSHYLSLAAEGAVKKQCIPSPLEEKKYNYELRDPLGENKFRPFEGLVHRYPDRALILLTDSCFTYCRHCFRRSYTSHGNGIISQENFNQLCRYISDHKEIKEVLLTGGDPFRLNDKSLLSIIRKIREIREDLLIRIGTRAPVVYPERFSRNLLKKINKYAPVWIITQFNHPAELSERNIKALNKIVNCGIPVLNQSVLLRNINDKAEILIELSRKLLENRVKPYYLFQGDLAEGTGHFRVPLDKGFEIVEEMRKKLSGMAMPLYAVDLPGGGGKIPLEKGRILRKDEKYYYFQSLYGGEYKYPIEE